METTDLSLSEQALERLNGVIPENVTSYYTGAIGCACGCQGNHRYVESYRGLESNRRGYLISDEEVVTIRSVRSLLTRLRNCIKTNEVSYYCEISDGFCVEVSNRTYIIRVFSKSKEQA